MNLREEGFPIIMEELYVCKFLAKTFCEIPVTLTARTDEQRPTSFSYRPRTLLLYLKFGLMALLGVSPRRNRRAE